MPIFQFTDTDGLRLLSICFCTFALKPTYQLARTELIFSHSAVQFFRLFFRFFIIIHDLVFVSLFAGGFDGNIFRFRRKLCTTRLNYRLQIAKNKTHTSNQFFTVSSLRTLRKTRKKGGQSVCSITFTQITDCDDIFRLNTLVCVIDHLLLSIFVHQS